MISSEVVEQVSKTRVVHYAWIVASCGTLVLFSAIGLGRFAFGVLLPGMQPGLALTYRQVSFSSAINFVGYLIAVLLVPFLLRWLSVRAAVAAGLLLLGVFLVAVGLCSNFAVLLGLFFMVGLGSGFANIPMMTLTAPWFCTDQRGKANGLIIAGNGSGMIVAGFAIPFLNRIFGAQGWRAGWIVLGVIAVMAASVAGVFLRNHPSEMRLGPAGRTEDSPHRSQITDARMGRKVLSLLCVLYFVFGATVSVYATFIVSTMIHEYGFTEQAAGIYWSLIGLLSIFSGLGFGYVSDLFGRRRALIVAFATHSVAYLLAGFKIGTAALIVSVVLFGISLFAAPTLVTSAIGDYFESREVASKLSIVTLAVGAGQVLGPIAAGAIAGSHGLFTVSYRVAGVASAAAIVAAFMLPRTAHRALYAAAKSATD